MRKWPGVKGFVSGLTRVCLSENGRGCQRGSVSGSDLPRVVRARGKGWPGFCGFYFEGLIGDEVDLGLLKATVWIRVSQWPLRP